jgi:hypothetical protein
MGFRTKHDGHAGVTEIYAAAVRNLKELSSYQDGYKFD